MKFFLKLFSLKYIVPTILVIAAGLVMIRLGFWQLDRLAGRRLANEPLIRWVNAEALSLNSDEAIAELTSDEHLMEYRLVEVTGTYDFENQIVSLLRYYGTNYGVVLVTPLLINGTEQAVFIERGWIPQEDKAREDWGKYDESGEVTITGRIRLSEQESDFGDLIDPTLAPDEERLDGWFVLNVERIAEQADLDVDVVPGVYIQQMAADETAPPFRSETNIEITEGSHLGYAFQWFTFVVILWVGYPVYAHRLESGKIRVEKNEEISLNE